ncbi:MORN repeat-containing protein [Flagellimonas sp. S174]|uniref:MORN repeat-containing protein n=1 Tax=Flagellimonas sp. S174 TaxID=3410790 RepID=UPI003BF4F90B
MKKIRPLLTYALALFFAALALYFWSNSRTLKQELEANQQTKQDLFSRLAMHEALLQGDSLLIRGNYNDAIESYSEGQEPRTESDGAALEMRMAFAKTFLALQTQKNETDSNSIAVLDTTSIMVKELSSNEINSIDSLTFAVEKMRAQVSRLKKQLRKKANGQYLTFVTSKGSVVHYVGDVKDKKANGMGVALLSTGSRYEGQWKNNQRHGEGTFYWPDGQSYEGTYINDKRDGQGTYYWPNGEKYVGHWKADERFGEGVFYGKKGDIVASGIWEDDELVQEPNRRRK